MATLRMHDALPALGVPIIDSLLLVLLAGLAQAHLQSCSAAFEDGNAGFQEVLRRGELHRPLFDSLLDRLA